jgi:hypothetical protein
LTVNPLAVDFGESRTEAPITIFNSGGGSLSWTAQEVVREDADSPWIAQNISWLSLNKTSGTSASEIDRLMLTANRIGEPVGRFTNTGIRITGDNGESEVVRVSLTVRATLSVTPGQFSLSPFDTFTTLTASNTGSQPITYSVQLLQNPSNVQSGVPLPAGFSALPSGGTLAPNGSADIRIEWPEATGDFTLLIASDGGDVAVPFVFGAIIEGLSLTPSPLTVFVPQTFGSDEVQAIPSTLSIVNSGATSRTWTITVRDRQNPDASAPLTVSPNTGTTLGGETSTVAVAIVPEEEVTAGSGRYELSVTSGDGFQVVPVIIEILPIPELTLSNPPNPELLNAVDPISALDFGREEVVLTFYVVNTGQPGSQLFYRATYDGLDEEEPLIVSVEPLAANGRRVPGVFFDTSLGGSIPATPVRVTVNRANLREDVEVKEITITPVLEDLVTPFAILEPQVLSIRVERPPLGIEGAINRARPPYIERFVLLLRDTLGEVISTQTPEDLARLEFTIFENEVELDQRESNQFVSPPTDLKVNLAILLDFTGSLYFAGTEAAEDPLRPGEAVDIMKEATARFIDDLPAGYQVALLYYNDRQQVNRVIHQFSTDRTSLKSALAEFNLPPAQFGVSDIFDALSDAIALVSAADDDNALPFDDADLRAVVYISDGFDNASVISQSDVSAEAEAQRVRLYPVLYSANGEPVSFSDSIILATESGGNFKFADEIQKLTTILASEADLVLIPADTATPNFVSFQVSNLGGSPINWQPAVTAGNAWITNVSPSSGTLLQPGQSVTVSASLNPAGAPLGQRVEGQIDIVSVAGEANVVIQMTPRDSGGGLMAEDVDVLLNDTSGTLWRELQNQVVFTYITPKQDSFDYRLNVRYTPPTGRAVQGEFERDGVFFPGDVSAGQLALTTTGITENLRAANPQDYYRAEAYLRADYVPRDISRFRVRFFLVPPDDASAAVTAALRDVRIVPELAPGGLLTDEGGAPRDWRLIGEGDGIYQILTEPGNFLQYGAFGNLLRLQFENVAPYVAAFEAGAVPVFQVAMRVDNQAYLVPPAPGQPSESRYFLYPGGAANEGRRLTVRLGESDLAGPARDTLTLQAPGINPNDPEALDRDEDGLADFNDPVPNSEGQPGNLSVPNPLTIEANQDTGVFTVRNNRLDSYSFSIVPGSLPSWVTGVTYGADNSVTPVAVLQPGDSQQVNLLIDRTGLQPGFVTDSLTLTTDTFPDEVVEVTLVVP